MRHMPTTRPIIALFYNAFVLKNFLDDPNHFVICLIEVKILLGNMDEQTNMKVEIII